MARQCQLLQLARSTAYDQPKPVSATALVLMRWIDELQYPFAGARMLRALLRQEGYATGRRQVATLMRRMGITAIYRMPRTSQRHPAHRIYPYVLCQLTITRPNHVWAADITYIPMQRGFVYLCAIRDWANRRVLAWRLSNTLTTDFCMEAAQEALTRYGPPAIFNTDQGCQFTSQEFTGLLQAHNIQISMDGTGRWRDNVFVERLWRSLKYEEVYLHAYETVSAARKGVVRYRPSTISSGRIARLTDARPIACMVSTSLHGPPPRRRTPLGTPYELTDSVQTSGATSIATMPTDRAMTPLSHQLSVDEALSGSISPVYIREYRRFQLHLVNSRL